MWNVVRAATSETDRAARVRPFDDDVKVRANDLEAGARQPIAGKRVCGKLDDDQAAAYLKPEAADRQEVVVDPDPAQGNDG